MWGKNKAMLLNQINFLDLTEVLLIVALINLSTKRERGSPPVRLPKSPTPPVIIPWCMGLLKGEQKRLLIIASAVTIVV
jgi:hypothetical protein